MFKRIADKDDYRFADWPERTAGMHDPYAGLLLRDRIISKAYCHNLINIGYYG